MSPNVSEKLILAKALCLVKENQGWIFAPDDTVPEEAEVYAVYDGVQVIGYGSTLSRVVDLVKRAAIPIVFYMLPKVKR